MSVSTLTTTLLPFPVSWKQADCAPVLVIMGLAHSGKNTWFNTMANAPQTVGNHHRKKDPQGSQ
ncbi:MAG: hypothetical protein HQL98_13585 [Magnetococcales bacterium]|nr:hypothetical protein [Magnetococcales bacterium]